MLDHLPVGIFDAVVISGEYGIHKPDPRIFEIVCQQLSSQSSQTVISEQIFIGQKLVSILTNTIFTKFDRTVDGRGD